MMDKYLENTEIEISEENREYILETMQSINSSIACLDLDFEKEKIDIFSYYKIKGELFLELWDFIYELYPDLKKYTIEINWSKLDKIKIKSLDDKYKNTIN